MEIRDQVMRRFMWYLQHGENNCTRDEYHGERVFLITLHGKKTCDIFNNMCVGILKRNDQIRK
jgi:hypothetical protein